MNETDINTTLPDISLSLAAADVIPVFIFFLTIFLISKKLKTIHKLGGTLFTIASVAMLIGGMLQISYKFFIVLEKKKINILRYQFKYSMLISFAFIILSILIASKKIKWKLVFSILRSSPCIYFLISVLLSLIMLIICAYTLDTNKSTTNWIEVGINIVFQVNLLLLTLFGITRSTKEDNNKKHINI